MVEIARKRTLMLPSHRNGIQHAKTEVFAQGQRQCKLTLGYPGTIGGDFIDYIVADKIVLPEEHKSYYSEKVAPAYLSA